MPSFGGTSGLPDASSIPFHVLAAWALVKRSRGGPTYGRFLVESAGAGTFRCTSAGTHPRPSPRLPPVLFTARSGEDDLRFLWAATAPPISATQCFDARARPRAGNPPPREAVAPVRVRCPAVARRASPPAISRFTRAPGGAPPRSPSPGLLELARVLPACAGAAGEGREMTPRSHAVCLPSPRPPRGGVAAFAARTVRTVAPASVEGGSSDPCGSERHGPSTAE